MTPTPKEVCCEKCWSEDYDSTGEWVARCIRADCRCHSTPTTDWSKEQKHLFAEIDVVAKAGWKMDEWKEQLKEKILSLVTRTRQQTKKEIIERVEKMKKDLEPYSDTEYGYTQALTDLLTYLKGE